MFILRISELFFVVDMILKFFIAYKEVDDDDVYIADIEKTSLHYWHGPFFKELFVSLPLG